MRLVIDVLAGATAGVLTFYLVSPEPEPAPQPTAGSAELTDSSLARNGDGRGHAEGLQRETRARAFMYHTEGRTPESNPRSQSFGERLRLQSLRNEVIKASSEYGSRRGDSVLDCLGGVELMGTQKLRFSVEIESTLTEATIVRWQFVEVIDGQPLPNEFSSCAERALGGDLRIVPPAGADFPDYRGTLDIVYVIPAPSQ